MTYMLAETNFHPVDWVIVAIYLGLILLAGYYTNRFTGSVSNYLVAGRQVRKGLLIATFIGTELGLVSIAYSSQMGFTSGLAAFHIGVIAMLMTAAVGVTGFIVYRLRDSGVMTLPEYYEKRFGRKTRILGGFILVLAGVLNMGMFLRAGAEFIGGLTGLADPIQVNIIMTVLLVIVFAYVILGGVISVVITDYLQFAVLGVGFVIITAFCFSDVGWDGAVEASAKHQVIVQQQAHDAAVAEAAARGPDEAAAAEAPGPFVAHPEKALDPTTSPAFGLNYILFMVFLTFAGVSLWQPVTIRALIAASPKVAKQTYFWASVGYLVRLIVPCFWGACAMAYMLDTGLYDQYFPASGEAQISSLAATGMYLGQLLPPVLLGVILAGMLAAFMSTHDSYLLAWASSSVQDVIGPIAEASGRPLTESARILLTRILIFVIGCFLLVWSLWYPMDATLWNYMAVTGTIYFAGAFSVVAAGLYWRRASSVGAVLAMIMGIVAALGIVPWSAETIEQLTIPLWPGTTWVVLDPTNLALLAIALAAGAMVIGSLLFPDHREQPEAAQEVDHATAG